MRPSIRTSWSSCEGSPQSGRPSSTLSWLPQVAWLKTASVNLDKRCIPTEATKAKKISHNFSLFQEAEPHKDEETCLKWAAKRIKTLQTVWRLLKEQHWWMHTADFFRSIFRKGGKVMRTEQQVREVITNKKASLRRLKLCQTWEKGNDRELRQSKCRNITRRVRKRVWRAIGKRN